MTDSQGYCADTALRSLLLTWPDRPISLEAVRAVLLSLGNELEREQLSLSSVMEMGSRGQKRHRAQWN